MACYSPSNHTTLSYYGTKLWNPIVQNSVSWLLIKVPVSLSEWYIPPGVYNSNVNGVSMWTSAAQRSENTESKNSNAQLVKTRNPVIHKWLIQISYNLFHRCSQSRTKMTPWYSRAIVRCGYGPWGFFYTLGGKWHPWPCFRHHLLWEYTKHYGQYHSRRQLYTAQKQITMR